MCMLRVARGHQMLSIGFEMQGCQCQCRPEYLMKGSWLQEPNSSKYATSVVVATITRQRASQLNNI